VVTVLIFFCEIGTVPSESGVPQTASCFPIRWFQISFLFLYLITIIIILITIVIISSSSITIIIMLAYYAMNFNLAAKLAAAELNLAEVDRLKQLLLSTSRSIELIVHVSHS
jgi:hypothetical protein